MGMIIRELALWAKYIVLKLKYRGRIWFRGVPAIYAFPGSKIEFKCGRNSGKIHIFSHPLSNMIGLSQRVIIVAKNGGAIEINEGVCMSGCTIYSMESVTIGRNTDIGAGCKIIDNDFHPLPYSQRCPKDQVDKIKKSPIFIGEGCFIGANALILKGTSLGKNCVVGAGSVVTGVWPDNSIIAGNPARLIKENKE